MALSTRAQNSIKSEIERLKKQRAALADQQKLIDIKIEEIDKNILGLSSHIPPTVTHGDHKFPA